MTDKEGTEKMIDPKLSEMRQAFPDLSEQEILEILAEENRRVAEMERESENRKKDELKRRAKRRVMLLSITEMGRKTPASEGFKNRLESLKEQARISRSMLRNIGEAITPVSSLVCPDPAPADSSPQKKRKRTRITPDLIKRVADDAEQNPGLTYKKLAKLHGLSDEVFKPGKPLRLAVDLARTGNLGRHAAKPDKPFNDDN